MRKKNKITPLLSFFLIFCFFFFPLQSIRSEPFSEPGEIIARTADEPFTIKDFFITTLYGTFLGSIVGTATLTFEKYPTKKLKRIAQGASIGLYVGIIFGLTSFYGNSSNEVQRKFESEDFVKNYENYQYLLSCNRKNFNFCKN